MPSTPDSAARGQYQTQCIRNPSFDDDVYSDVHAPIEQAKVRLRWAYVVAGVLIGVSLLTALVPAIYVASTAASRFDGGDGGNWTVCWPCRRSSSTSGVCCSTLADADFTCSDITPVTFRRCRP